jgi:hypothetical protein
MPRVATIKPQFVQYIPAIDAMKEGVIYISAEFKTAVHLCCCGCKKEVVTPLNPAKWKVTGNRMSVTLNPSIGNWSYPCRSHYFIQANRVVWASQFSEAQIQRVQAADQRAVARHVARSQKNHHSGLGDQIAKAFVVLWRFLKDVFSGRR